MHGGSLKLIEIIYFTITVPLTVSVSS